MTRPDATERLGREVRNARRAAGLTQSQLANRASLSQAQISRIERGICAPDLRAMARIANGAGHTLSVRLYPFDGIRLRDSGQLSVAELIRAQAHRSWRVRIELPVASAPDRRAADMVLDSPAEVVLLEIERAPRDLQAQLRAAQLKRVALSERLGRVVRLVVAMPDTVAARKAVAPHLAILRAGLPITSRAAWAAIRSGARLGGDALLWVRRR